jgi:hypothetical protein
MDDFHFTKITKIERKKEKSLIQIGAPSIVLIVELLLENV